MEKTQEEWREIALRAMAELDNLQKADAKEVADKYRGWLDNQLVPWVLEINELLISLPWFSGQKELSKKILSILNKIQTDAQNNKT